MHPINQSKSGSEKRVKRRTPIKPHLWYIVVIIRNQEYKIGIYALNKLRFPDHKTADLFLKNNKELKDYFTIRMLGSDILDYGIKLRYKAMSYLNLDLKYINKYLYPPERITFQGKKSYRTKLRRQMRDHGKPQNEKFY